jgi:hypothetical protein
MSDRKIWLGIKSLLFCLVLGGLLTMETENETSKFWRPIATGMIMFNLVCSHSYVLNKDEYE